MGAAELRHEQEELAIELKHYRCREHSLEESLAVTQKNVILAREEGQARLQRELARHQAKMELLQKNAEIRYNMLRKKTMDKLAEHHINIGNEKLLQRETDGKENMMTGTLCVVRTEPLNDTRRGPPLRVAPRTPLAPVIKREPRTPCEEPVAPLVMK
eukprot:NODE_3206_length_802_cov_68.662683_g2675_i0.p1 GENE.NODE_3206_length_802_cov_68.662683_g2675_i0~~NODE_3206_length_802_cov_68.662683_g2675_i0.p1  ORF type:complete len:167 (-),score=53.86 NODE_3206_length_802_cov_68.662683_g2675_i0:300-773(-)